MALEILFFGQLTDVVKASSIELDDVRDLEHLRSILFECYPDLAHMKFIIAVNGKVHTDDLPLPPDAQVALLPPFSGG